MLHTLTLAQALKQLEDKRISIEELHADVLHSIEEQNDHLNAYLTVSDASALEIAKGNENTPLRGVPLALKDNISTVGIRTTASSHLLSEFRPQYQSTVDSLLSEAGATIMGKTNLDAWAHGSSTETSQFDRTLNPRNTEYLPGGSSGGSAAAVAADMCTAAIGTETAGSIRQPAAWCGVVGLKPTYGRVSRFGIVAMASSTDSPGPITKTVEDAAILLNHLAGRDKYDATTGDQPVPDFTSFLGKSIKGLKIGVTYLDLEGLEAIKPQYEAVIEVLRGLGATVEFVQALDPHYAIGVYTVVQRAEVSSNLARYDDVRYQHGREAFGPEAKRRIMLGTYTLAKGYAEQYYILAEKVRSLFLQDYTKLFGHYDVLISPTSPGYAKKIGASEGESMFGELEDMLLEPSSISGLPGISVPCYRDPKTNLYLGLNIVAPKWREDLVIQVADTYERATDWNSWRAAEK